MSIAHDGHPVGQHNHDRHGPSADAGRERRVLVAFLITAGFMVVEAVGGFLAGSLALLADAAHMLTDSAALLVAWIAFRLGRMPPDNRRSYGYRRLEVLAAMANGLAVVVLAAWIVYEAAQRISEPVTIHGAPMLAIAAVGMAVNLLVLRVLHAGHTHGDLNMQGAVLHVLGDLLGSVAAVAAALVILWWGWTPIDPILSIGVAGLIIVNAWRLVRSAAHILLEGAPAGFDEAEVRRRLTEAVPGVRDVHHVHAWSLTSGQALLTLHATVSVGADPEAVLARIKDELVDTFGIAHSVVQIERKGCPDLENGCA